MMQIPGGDGNEKEWAQACGELKQLRAASGGQIVSHMFEGDEAGRKAFCDNLSQAILTQVDAWEEKNVELALECIKLLMFDRPVESINSLFSQEMLKVYCKCLGSTSKGIRGEAVKCLNNSLFDHSENQKTFAHITPKDEGYGMLLHLLKQTDDLENFNRACFVAMFLFAGEQIAEDLVHEISREFVQVTIQAMLDIATTSNRLEDLDQSSRDALTSGFKLVYSVAVMTESVFQEMYVASRKHFEMVGVEQITTLLNNMSLMDVGVPLLDRLGFLMVKLVRAQELEDELTLQAVNVLMLSCKFQGFADFVQSQGTVKNLCTMLEAYLDNIASETMQVRLKYFGRILPLVIALTTLAEASEPAKQELKQLMFPRTLPELNLDELTEEEAKQKMNSRKNGGNTPPDVLSGKLIPFMTCFDSNIKRYSGELLFLLCNQDVDEMTTRCGMGHSAHILAIKSGQIGQIMSQQQKK